MREKICGIYKIVNLVNGKVYIGQSQDIYNRWHQHKDKYKKRKDNIILYQAFDKYGIENFSFEIIEECLFEELNEKEMFYIDKYRSYAGWEDGHGYNMTIGGALCHTHVGNDDQGIRVYQYDKEGNFVAEYRNMNKAAKAVGLKESTSISVSIKKDILQLGTNGEKNIMRKFQNM